MKNSINLRDGKLKFSIGPDKPTFIIAELSANHNQSFDIAAKTIKAAKKSGADAIKLQTYTADTITINSNNKYFQIKNGLWKGRSLYDLYKEASMPWEWQLKLKKIANELGLICFSSPFDNTAVDFLERLEMPAYKIASAEITDLPLIQYVASMGKPIFISTGIASLDDIIAAVEACREEKNNQIIILKCTSAYPAPVEEANLKLIPDLAERFNLITGLSDHTLGISTPIASVALGACVIEKHFIIDKNIDGPDTSFSLDPSEFKSMVNGVRDTEKSLGVVDYGLTDIAMDARKFSRSLFIVKKIKKGEIFTKENVRSIRPGYGLPPKHINQIIGKKALKNLDRGTPLKWEFVNI